MAKKKNISANKQKRYYDTSKMTSSKKYWAIRRLYAYYEKLNEMRVA